jgi:DNA-binding MarR family transcriptional regulator
MKTRVDHRPDDRDGTPAPRHANGQTGTVPRAAPGATSGAGQLTDTLRPAPGPAPRSTEAELVAFVELLFFAYRGFTSDPDAVLQHYGFGRAHHRVLHFVNRQPGLRVADLLIILKITKQSLGPVLKQLVDRGFVMQTTGDADRRERHLHLTPAGSDLASQLRALQTQRMAAALDHAHGRTMSALERGADGRNAKGGDTTAPTRRAEVVRAFLLGMIAGQDRPAVEQLLEHGASALTAKQEIP